MELKQIKEKCLKSVSTQIAFIAFIVSTRVKQHNQWRKMYLNFENTFSFSLFFFGGNFLAPRKQHNIENWNPKFLGLRYAYLKFVHLKKTPLANSFRITAYFFSFFFYPHNYKLFAYLKHKQRYHEDVFPYAQRFFSKVGSLHKWWLLSV